MGTVPTPDFDKEPLSAVLVAKKLAEEWYSEEHEELVEMLDEGEEGPDPFPTAYCIHEDGTLTVMAFDPNFMNDKEKFFGEVLPTGVKKASEKCPVTQLAFSSPAWGMDIPSDSWRRNPEQMAASRGESMRDMEGKIESVLITSCDKHGNSSMHIARVTRQPPSLSEWQDMEDAEGRGVDGARAAMGFSPPLPEDVGPILYENIMSALGHDPEEIMHELMKCESLEEILEKADDFRKEMENLTESQREEIGTKTREQLLIHRNQTAN